jgi:hypothetical protein
MLCDPLPLRLQYGLYALYWVVEVAGKPTRDLDAFIEVISELPDGGDVRVKLIALVSGKSKVKVRLPSAARTRVCRGACMSCLAGSWGSPPSP